MSNQTQAENNNDLPGFCWLVNRLGEWIRVDSPWGIKTDPMEWAQQCMVGPPIVQRSGDHGKPLMQIWRHFNTPGPSVPDSMFVAVFTTADKAWITQATRGVVLLQGLPAMGKICEWFDAICGPSRYMPMSRS